MRHKRPLRDPIVRIALFNDAAWLGDWPDHANPSAFYADVLGVRLTGDPDADRAAIDAALPVYVPVTYTPNGLIVGGDPTTTGVAFMTQDGFAGRYARRTDGSIRDARVAVIRGVTTHDAMLSMAFVDR